MPCCVEVVDDLFEDCAEELHNDLQARESFAEPSALSHYQPRLPLFPTHLHLYLDFDIKNRTLKARARHTLEARISHANTITLNAEDFISVTASSPDDEDLTYSYDGHIVEVHFSHTIPKTHKVSLDIEYVVENPIDGLFFSRPYEGYFVVSDHETERARYWLPVVDHPSVRTTVDFDITTAANENLTVLANGELVSETIDPQDPKKMITRWSMKQPTPSYILCIAIGQFIRCDVASLREKPVAFFCPSGDRISYTVEDLALTFGRTNEMLEFMEKKVGADLPWPKYFQWACGEVSGAMENSSLVSYDIWYLLDERSVAERSHRVDSTVVHELAHTWFGNTVVCGDFAHSFLKESFATLISAEWYDFKNGRDDFQYTLLTYASSAFSETDDYVRPIVTRQYDSSWSLFDRHLYVNGAWRLHMLRVKLGDEQFWNAVSAYIKNRAWTTVETDDFRKDLEEFSGEELVSFFDQWFYGKGHPVLDVSFSYSAADKTATISTKQVQVNESKGISLFDIRVEVAVETTRAKWERHELVMCHGSAFAQVTVKAETKPLQVVIDPDMNVLHNIRRVSGLTDDMWLRTLSHGRTVAARYQAVRQLKEEGSKRGRRGLCDALRKEKHWGMRTLIAQALAKMCYVEVLDALIDAMFHENDARVVPTLVSSVGDLRDVDKARVGKALLEFVHDGEEKLRGYGAMAAALKSIGRLKNSTHVDLLRSFVEDDAKRGGSFEMAQGAAMGLGLMRESGTAVLMDLIEKSADGRWTARLRGSLVRALANSVSLESRTRRVQVFEFIVTMSRQDDTPKGFRMACAWAIATLADAGNAMEPLNALEKRAENQSKVAIRKLMKRSVRNASRGDFSSRQLVNMVDKLQKELKDLKKKMDELQIKFDTTKGNGSTNANTQMPVLVVNQSHVVPNDSIATVAGNGGNVIAKAESEA